MALDQPPGHTLPAAAVRLRLLREAVGKSPTANIKGALSDILFDFSEEVEAAFWFREAYLQDPMACPFHVDVDADRTIRRAESLIAHGAGFSTVLAALGVAFARTGRDAELAALVDYERLLVNRPFSEPDRRMVDASREELVDEILATLTPYAEPAHLSVRHAHRSDRLLTRSTPAVAVLRTALERCVHEYIDSLALHVDHPFLLARPKHWVLEGWGVVSNAEGHHRPHIHPRAWMSGVTYLLRPLSSFDNSARQGWLRVGPPPKFKTATTWPERWIEPTVGSVVLMPGYFFHETRATGVSERRICVAFDVVPLEIYERAPQGHGMTESAGRGFSALDHE